MEAISVMIVYIISILAGIAIMNVAYNVGVSSQKQINKLINDRDKYDGFLKGYKLGYDKGKSEKSKCDGKR